MLRRSQRPAASMATSVDLIQGLPAVDPYHLQT